MRGWHFWHKVLIVQLLQNFNKSWMLEDCRANVFLKYWYDLAGTCNKSDVYSCPDVLILRHCRLRFGVFVSARFSWSSGTEMQCLCFRIALEKWYLKCKTTILRGGHHLQEKLKWSACRQSPQWHAIVEIQLWLNRFKYSIQRRINLQEYCAKYIHFPYTVCTDSLRYPFFPVSWRTFVWVVCQRCLSTAWPTRPFADWNGDKPRALLSLLFINVWSKSRLRTVPFASFSATWWTPKGKHCSMPAALFGLWP